ncbi:MAG: GatB/YqeY domain-containing protein [Firmicutes bacterium]|nr:GatB/YqeY domain-containing protein [Bacillota bacterium]
MILEQLKEKMKESMKAKDKFTLTTVRMTINKLQQKSKELGRDLNEAEEIDVLTKEVKQRKDAVKMFDREDLIEQYEKEVKIIEQYLPEQMSEEEVMKLVNEKCQAEELSGPQDMGKAMKTIMPLVKGKADGNMVKECVSRVLKG